MRTSQSTLADESYITYATRLIYLENGSSKCELAQFGMVPVWASDKRNTDIAPKMPDFKQFLRNQHLVYTLSAIKNLI